MVMGMGSKLLLALIGFSREVMRPRDELRADSPLRLDFQLVHSSGEGQYDITPFIDRSS